MLPAIDLSRRKKGQMMSIQKLRLDRGWSQEQLAQYTGLSVRTIQRIENGKRASLESLKCLAAVFETTVSKLVREQEVMNQENTSSQPIVNEAEREAIVYVKNLKAFHLNWISFVVMIPCLYLLNIKISPDFLWVTIVAIAWGGAIILNAFVIYGLFHVFSGEWEQREFLKRMRFKE